MQRVEDIRVDFDARGGGEFVASGRFVITSCTRREGKNGPFLVLDLRDPSGNLVARCFDAVLIDRLACATAIDAKLRVSEFNGTMSAVLQSFDPAELEPTEMLEYAGLDAAAHAERVAVLEAWLAECDGTIYGDVLRAVFTGDAWQRLCMAPAAVRMHHAEPGGLVRHLCEVGKAGLALLDSLDTPYDRAYFLAGVFLHDIGKLDTYTAPPSIAYTAQGRMGEHQIWSTFRLAKACAAVAAPSSIEAKLVHIVEQAHGAFRHADWQDPIGVEVKALATADFFSARLGVTEKERQAEAAFQALLSDDSVAIAEPVMNAGSDVPFVPSSPPAVAAAVAASQNGAGELPLFG